MNSPISDVGSSPISPGWYSDPWKQAVWRWWDGRSWTAHCAPAAEKKPRLPSWLSAPVVVCGICSLIAVLYIVVTAPLAVVLGFVPLVLVAPVLVWLDRVEPESVASRVHALLWGGSVAVVIALVVNTIVALMAGETVGAVVSAPLVEEAAKAAGILWAVRRREVDGVMDGIVYAGWVALGFAVVEDGLYFADASQSGVLVQTFVVRALLTPFAHPLFTAWSGIAIGKAIANNKPAFPAVIWGYVIAVALHATWNGSLSWAGAGGDEGAVVVLVAAAMFVCLFTGMVIVLRSFRRSEQKRLTDMVPFLIHRYAMTPTELAAFGDWGNLNKVRGSLSRTERRAFDRVHASLAQLSMLHGRPGDPDPVEETRLLAQLQAARALGF